MQHRSIASLPVRLRLHLATMAAIIALVTMAALVNLRGARQLNEARLATLSAVAESARAVIAGYAAQAQAGRISTADAQREALTALRLMRYGADNYLWVQTQQAVMIMHPIKPELDGKDASGIADPNGVHVFQAAAEVTRAADHGTFGYLWPRPGASTPVPKLSYALAYRPWGWVIGTGVYIDDILAQQWRLAEALAVMTLIMAIGVGLIIWWLGRSIAAPMRRLCLATDAISHGVLHEPITDAGRGDEFGQLAQALDVLRRGAIEREQLGEQTRIEQVAKDRRRAAIDTHTQEFGASFSAVMGRMALTADAVRRSAAQMSDAAEATRSQAERSSASARDATATLESVAVATEQMAASADEIGTRVSVVLSAAGAAVDAAGQSDRIMQDLLSAAAEIGEVLGLIGDIAAQTNLLALNATIEAARAGDAGKGFAVVASEVKGLANETRLATDQVGRRIAAVRRSTQEASAAIGSVGQAIGRVNAAAAEIADAITQQTGGTRAIAQSVTSVSETTAGTTQVIERLAGIAGDTRAGSLDVLNAADEVRTQTSALRGELDQFLTAIREADRDRRSYERIPAQDLACSLSSGWQAATNRLTCSLIDLSRGGAQIAIPQDLPVGAEVTLQLPFLAEPLQARVVRHGGGRAGLSFRHDQATMQLADRAILALQGQLAA
jgi:methyl-accepting chemotaxis protein